MAKFFDTFEVIEEETPAAWTRSPQEGYGIDALDEGFTSILTDICAPADRPAPPDYNMGVTGHPYAVIGNLVAPVRCSPPDLRSKVVRMMAGATEYQTSKALWYGVGKTGDTDPDKVGDLYLTHSDVHVTPRAADYGATLAAVLEAAYKRNPHVQPVVHLGWQAALALQFGIQNLGLPFVVPPGYPANAIAVTDKVTIRLSPIVTVSSVRRTDNRIEYETSRFGTIEFLPHLAVRAADSV